MRSPGYVTERGSSWREVAATWIIAAVVLGLVGFSGCMFGYRSQPPADTGPALMTTAAEADVDRRSRGWCRTHRVSAQTSARLNAR